MKKLICLLTAFVMMTAMLGQGMAFAVETEDLNISADSEAKVYSTATLEDDFADDRVMVVLKNDVSLDFKTYSTEDFASIGCKNVRDFSQASAQKVKQQYDTMMAAVLSRTAVPETVDAERIGSYNQILCIDLEESGKENVLAAIKELEKRDDVYYAGPDYRVSLCSSTDAAYSDTYIDDQWALEKIQVPEAWEITTGSATIKVGVLDTGIDGQHPDLEDKVDLYDSWDFTLGVDNINVIPTDPNGYGTMVAGIIAATLDNSIGISGVSPDVILASLRVFGSNGYGYSSYVAAAIEYAEYDDIPILNFSGGWGYGSELYDCVLEGVIENYSGLFICSAGNGTGNNDGLPIYPANYDIINLITVAASTEDDWIKSDSNYGKESVDIFAPGDGILTCLPTSMTSNCGKPGYCLFGGTSASAPHVSAVAALMLSECPSLTPYEIKTKIMNSSDKLDVFTDLCVSGGRLNAYKSVQNLHTFQCTAQNAYTHVTACDCGKQTVAEHTWIAFGTKYKCKQCGYVTAIIPSVTTLKYVENEED